MKKLVINGGKKLKGEVKISGAKNSAVALIPAAILSFLTFIKSIHQRISCSL